MTVASISHKTLLRAALLITATLSSPLPAWAQSAVTQPTSLAAPAPDPRVQKIIDLLIADRPDELQQALLALPEPDRRRVTQNARDFLWPRAGKLKDEGKFAEADQTAQWVTALDPHFVPAWVFQSSNMVFNLAAASRQPAQRWAWVKKAIELLRDKAIPLNPSNAELPRELSRIFFIEIAQYSDDANGEYKVRLAAEWQEFLGAPAEALTTAEAADQFAHVANAPATLEAMLATAPQIRPLLDKLKGIGLSPDEKLVREIGRINMFVLHPAAIAGGFSLENPGLGVDAGLCKLMADPSLAAPLDALTDHLRKRALIDHYHMDPGYMLELMRTYGPLDWRHPATHALYWSSLPALIGPATQRTPDPKAALADGLHIYRNVIPCLQELMVNGRLIFEPLADPPRYELLPDPRFVPAYDRALDLAGNALALLNTKDARKVRSAFEQDHIAFLEDAMDWGYLRGDAALAQPYYDKLRRLYGPSRADQFNKSLEDLIRDDLMANLDTRFHTQVFVDSMLLQAFEKGLANGRPEVYDRFLNLARLTDDKYRATHQAQADAAKGRGGPPIALDPFDDQLANAYVFFMNATALSALQRAQVWKATPLELRLATYHRLAQTAGAQAAKAGLDPKLAFPRPEEPADHSATQPETH